MEYHQNSTIVAQMQPIFDALPEKLKDEKLRRGMTNQQLSDVSGVPIATTSRIIAGAVSNPGIYHIAPLCAALGVSMDALMGMPTQGSSAAELDGLRQELEHKTELLSEKEAAVGRLLDRSRILENGISARDEQIQRQEEDIRRKDAEIKELRNFYKPLVYGLCGLCILLTVVWCIFVVLDARQPGIGLIRSGAVSPLIWIGAAAVVVLLITILCLAVRRFYRKIG